MTFNSVLTTAKPVTSGRTPLVPGQQPPPCWALPLPLSGPALQTQGFRGGGSGEGVKLTVRLPPMPLEAMFGEPSLSQFQTWGRSP